MKKLQIVAAAIFLVLSSLTVLAQTQPNFENGWKPYGSYDGSHLDTINLMNGNLMFHAPLTPDTPQRGSLHVSNYLYGSYKDWQAVCFFNSSTQQMQCDWQKGGGAISVRGTPALSVHRTLDKQYTNNEGATIFAGYGYTIISADGSAHRLHGVAGTEDVNGEPTQFDSVDLSGYHLALSVPDANFPTLLDQATVTDRSGNQYQGNFGPSTGCGRIQFSGPSVSGGGGLFLPSSHPPMIDDAPAGDQYCSQVAYATLITDSNGNRMNVGGPQNLVATTDTLGKTLALRMPFNSADGSLGTPISDFSGCVSSHTIAAAYLLDYQDPNGVTQHLKLCTAEIQIQTSFGQPNPYNSTLVSEAVTSTDPSSGLHFFAVVSAVLGDGSRWSFDYDSYGELTSVILPSGGGIAYTWTTIDFDTCNPRSDTRRSRAVATRTLDDGQGHSFKWTYNWVTLSSTGLTNLVTDPLGNDTEHIFTELSPQAGLAATCRFYETATVQYQGPKSAGKPLQRVDTAYSVTAINTDTGGFGASDLGNVFATDVTTTLYTDGTPTKVKLVHKDPDPGLGAGLPIFGNTIRELDYDWGAYPNHGALLRETDTTYKWQLDPAYRTAGLLDLPASVVVKDPAGNRVAETDYNYDEFALQTNSGGIPASTVAPPASVRGNQTTVSQWLSTTNSFVSSHTHWYDTGEPYQKIDPLGHPTTFSYDPAYAGAYVTQTCNALSQCVSGTYDFYTGLLTSFSNQNASTPASGLTPGDIHHTWLYSYDLMFRIAQAQGPVDPANGSQRATTNFAYATAPGVYPWTVTRSRSVTGAPSDFFTASYDGLGRAFQTQHTMPVGPPSTVITTYDALGRVASVTNPFFTTSDATYGVTQTIYDVLDRPLLVLKPDSSYATVVYHDNCTTTQDEAGNPRRSCTDALGRLYQVDEPGGATAPSATDTSNTDSYATAAVNISGTEQVVLILPPPCPPHQICDQTPDTIYDSGTVSVTVNGHTTSATYGQGDDASAVALHLANAVTNDPAAVVNGSASGTLITLTARDPGRIGDYTLSVSWAYDTADFSKASFTASATSFRLAGGSNDSVFNNAWVTQYHYDVLGNLLCVEQHGDAPVGVNGATGCPAPSTGANSLPVPPDPANPWRLRQFAYDSLSRLRWASNPESGVITYQYDLDGNLLYKTSPRANQTGADTTTISYCYDQLNRLLAKGYADSPAPAQQCLAAAPWLTAPAATFTYDAGTDARGHLTSLTDQAGSGSYAYDAQGRQTSEQRMLYGANNVQISKTIAYAYQLGGSLKSLTYPSGRVVNYTVDSAARLLKALDANGTQYVTNATYWANGAEFQQWMPNIYFRTDLNNRLQIAGLYSDNGVTASYFMNKTYSYGAQNNGNVMSIVNNKDTSRTETFTYDALNRITSGWSTADTGALSWGENYAVDAWGNLMTSPMLNKAHGGNFQCAGDPQNRATCLSYDAAGNVTANAPATYTYDQENRISSTAGMTYIYDANGNRVEKTGAGGGTLYWYGSPGILAESDLSGNLKSEYVFFGGKRVARIDSPGNSVHYYLSDHLNSTSMVVSAAGITEEESDYSPFGTEYPVISSGANHYKFTGKERDAETCAAGSCLDYFGARYYSNGLGRFITPDWAAKAKAVPYGDFRDPQSLNLYGYVRNLPTSRVDPSGHKVEYLPNKKNAEEANKRVLSNVSNQERKLFHMGIDKNSGRHVLKLDTKAAAHFKGKHTVGYQRLVTAINSDRTAVVSIQSTVGAKGDDNVFHVYNVGSSLGGGATSDTNTILVALSPNGNVDAPGTWKTQGPNGTKLPDPVGIIAGHELLGHAVDRMTTGVTSEDSANHIEDLLRSEQGLSPRVK